MSEPLRAVDPRPRRRRPRTVLAAVLDAIKAHPDLSAELDPDETRIIEPMRGRPITLVLQYRDGDTLFLDASRGEE